MLNSLKWKRYAIDKTNLFLCKITKTNINFQHTEWNNTVIFDSMKKDVICFSKYKYIRRLKINHYATCIGVH